MPKSARASFSFSGTSVSWKYRRPLHLAVILITMVTAGHTQHNFQVSARNSRRWRGVVDGPRIEVASRRQSLIAACKLSAPSPELNVVGRAAEVEVLGVSTVVSNVAREGVSRAGLQYGERCDRSGHSASGSWLLGPVGIISILNVTNTGTAAAGNSIGLNPVGEWFHQQK